MTVARAHKKSGSSRTTRTTPRTSAGFVEVTPNNTLGVTEHVLQKNGLRVLHRHIPDSGAVGLMVTYLVGSRHEVAGNTGSTHILEHLMFKGSKHFPAKKGMSVIDAFAKKGALVNASTWLDRTNYYEVVPKEHFAECCAVEADRMRHANITEKDLRAELPAVISEYALHKNNTREVLDEHMWHTAFLAHGYHHSTIGWLSDIESASVAQLQHFYDTYYHPNNAVVSVVGDAPLAEVLGLVREHFGVHPRSLHPIPKPHTKEPEQQGERMFVIERTQGSNMLAVGWKVPPALHKDTPVLRVLADVLGGSDSSLLHHALVEGGLCADVHVEYVPFHDAALFLVYATLLPNVAHSAVQQRIERVIEGLRTTPLAPELVAHTRAAIEREMLESMDGHYQFLSVINEYIATGDWTLYERTCREVAQVVPEDVQRCAVQYCTTAQQTIGMVRVQASTH
jgi:zinc protease